MEKGVRQVRDEFEMRGSMEGQSNHVYSCFLTLTGEMRTLRTAPNQGRK